MVQASRFSSAEGAKTDQASRFASAEEAAETDDILLDLLDPEADPDLGVAVDPDLGVAVDPDLGVVVVAVETESLRDFFLPRFAISEGVIKVGLGPGAGPSWAFEDLLLVFLCESCSPSFLSFTFVI